LNGRRVIGEKLDGGKPIGVKVKSEYKLIEVKIEKQNKRWKQRLIGENYISERRKGG
jgi:hypothetical protein